MKYKKQILFRFIICVTICSLVFGFYEKLVRVRLESCSSAIYGKQMWKISANHELVLDVKRVGMTKLAKSNTWSGAIPESYDGRLEYRTSIVKDQNDLGTCWAFAALTAIENSLRPEENLIFSPDHMTLENDFSVEQKDGGQYTMAMAYLTSWRGPVLEADDPYNDGVSSKAAKAAKHIQEIQIIPEKDYDMIKRFVYSYGAVQSSLYTSLTSAESKSKYYNNRKAAYCYTGKQESNHDIVIVGWDDQFPKENFSQQVEGDGAFLCQNSWGKEFGEKGFFYVSYYDSNIGLNNIVYTKIESNKNYDCIYQSDLCGWVGQLGYGSDHAYFSNIYQVEKDQTLSAAGFYATDNNTKYKVYTVYPYNNVDSLLNRTLVQSGVLKNAGFYTLDFNKEVEVKSGEKFAVMVEITTPNTTQPVAVEYRAGEITQNANLDDGEGYISFNGTKWTSVEKTEDCNLCLKVYANDIQ